MSTFKLTYQKDAQRSVPGHPVYVVLLDDVAIGKVQKRKAGGYYGAWVSYGGGNVWGHTREDVALGLMARRRVKVSV